MIKNEENRIIDQKKQVKQVEFNNQDPVAHLPFLTILYLHLHKSTVGTPLTALEMSLYLNTDIHVVEKVFELLEEKHIVRPLKQGLPAYVLNRSLKDINFEDLLELMHCYQKHGEFFSNKSLNHAQQELQSNKYRQIYSDLASELLHLFGVQTANDLPI